MRKERGEKRLEVEHVQARRPTDRKREIDELNTSYKTFLIMN